VAADEYAKLPGEDADPEAFEIPKATELLAYLSGSIPRYARLVECRQGAHTETVIYEVEPELPQVKEVDIHHVERLAVIFFADDEITPETLALRVDFPTDFIHRNLRPAGWLPSLCLWEEQYVDLRRRWTAARYVERVREWLALTATGTLHQEDQPLEPLLATDAPRLICPHELFEPGGVVDELRMVGGRVDIGSGRFTYFVNRPEFVSQSADPTVIAVVLSASPQVHGVIRHAPETLADLHHLLQPTGFDLLSELRLRFKEWILANQNRNLHLLLLLRLPKKRSVEATEETVELWAFYTDLTAEEVAVDVGAAAEAAGHITLSVPVDMGMTGVGTKLIILAPVKTLSRSVAAGMNGYPASSLHILAVGCGAMGSQVLTNLVRGGFGTWSIVDDDVLLPHNLARHALGGVSIGRGKADAVAAFSVSLVDSDAVAGATRADVRNPRQFTDQQLDHVEAIIDFSASVSVGRHLALDRPSTARRVSVFLNPTGTDLVVLAEDAGRTTRLDELEMQYYRALLQPGNLENHLKTAEQPRRYANACRDVTSTVSQEAIGLFAGIGARAIRHVLSDPQGCIRIWRSSHDLTVDLVEVPVLKHFTVQIGDWRVSYDSGFLGELNDLRSCALPKETGGVLLGSYDLDRRIIYLIGTIQPADSEEWPTHYIRGSAGLPEAVAQAGLKTLWMVEYVGEWHSHPDGCSVQRSSDDLKVSAWIRTHLAADGLPGLMLIVGEAGRLAIYLEP
jgi:hypothetical protein